MIEHYVASLDARTRKRIQPWLVQIRSAAAVDDYRTLLRLGTELERYRLPMGVALQAQAHLGLGRSDRALDVLQRGVTTWPGQWLLWVDLADVYAGRREFDEAWRLYATARGVRGANVALVEVHRAVSLSHDHHHLEAIDLLQSLETPDRATQVESLLAQCEIFNQQEGPEYVFSRVDRALTLIGEDGSRDYTDELVRLHTAAGRACLLQGDPTGAQDNARRALHVRRGGFKGTLALLRDVRGERSRLGHFYNLLVQGRTSEGQTFATTYGVVAETPEEGLEYCRGVERDPTVAETLLLQGAETVEPAPGALRGVYTLTPLYETG